MPEPTPLAERLRVLRADHPDADPALLAEVAVAVLAGLSASRSAAETTLLTHVAELRQTIQAAKAEIAALSAGDISRNDIPSATDELDAIVQHTAAATDAILETCEALDEVAGVLGGETAVVLRQATTRIYEACSFQDITGQRISKIVATLKIIDNKVARMIEVFGARDDAAPLPAVRPAALLNGPQLSAHAMQQADVDQLLASFD